VNQNTSSIDLKHYPRQLEETQTSKRMYGNMNSLSLTGNGAIPTQGTQLEHTPPRRSQRRGGKVSQVLIEDASTPPLNHHQFQATQESGAPLTTFQNYIIAKNSSPLVKSPTSYCLSSRPSSMTETLQVETIPLPRTANIPRSQTAPRLRGQLATAITFPQTTLNIIITIITTIIFISRRENLHPHLP
jgi:hypothetical protein